MHKVKVNTGAICLLHIIAPFGNKWLSKLDVNTNRAILYGSKKAFFLTYSLC